VKLAGIVRRPLSAPRGTFDFDAQEWRGFCARRNRWGHDVANRKEGIALDFYGPGAELAQRQAQSEHRSHHASYVPVERLLLHRGPQRIHQAGQSAPIAGSAASSSISAGNRAENERALDAIAHPVAEYPVCR
jgi:hypothetical protein